MSPEKTLSVILHRTKDTKNTVRYESADSDDRAPIDSLYLRKFALEGARPEKIQVVITLE